MSNFVFVGTSIDGCIAAPDGNMEWMSYVPNPEGDDLGFSEFMARVDAVVMGRNTFETLLGFGIGWHYPKPGIVLSTTLKSVPAEFKDHVRITSGTPAEVVEFARQQGFDDLYIDGGNTIQRFLQEDLIDELIITEIPLLLGGGAKLFGELPQRLDFELVDTAILLNQLLRKRLRRKRG